MGRESLPSDVAISYSQEYRRCGKAGCAQCSIGGHGHGPYWYASWKENGKRKRRYLGRNVSSDITLKVGVPNAEAPFESERQSASLTSDNVQTALPLRIQALGAFAVWVFGERIPDILWGKRRSGALVKCLLSMPGQRISRDLVSEYLWPEMDSDASGRNLRQALHQVRHVLRHGAPLATSGPSLRTSGDWLVLVPGFAPSKGEVTETSAWIDAAAFESAASRALEGRNATQCRLALNLYSGEYLPNDQGEPWAEGPRQRLRQLYLRLLLHVSDLCGALGEQAEAAEHLRTILITDPLHEEASVRLMALLGAQDKGIEALRVYQALARALDEELGAEPGLDLQTLRSRIVAAMKAPRLAAQTPRQPLADRPTNLPSAMSSFLGRTWERSEVTRVLRGDTGGSCRLLTLTGAGGVGKTRLAQEVGQDLIQVYPDGVWMVELAGIDASATADPATVTQAVVTSLGVKEEANKPLLETLMDFLRVRQLLLLLDNCEHLAQACAALTAILLQRCPGLIILATSRVVLRVPGEIVWTVSTLSVPPENISEVDELAQYEAVQLFVARGRAAQVSFTLTARTASMVAQICRRLDGIPLAIELAAARLGVLGIEEVAARLDDCFRVLTGGNRTLLPRQQTLQASLEWSYNLLGNAEQSVLRRLSVFAGGCTLAAAEVVCAVDQTEEPMVVVHIGNLVRNSMVVLWPDFEPARYKLLEPVRQYCQAQLHTSDEAISVQDQHLTWCVTLADEATPHLIGQKQGAWLSRLDIENDNLRVALDWACKRQLHEQNLRLTGALTRFWYMRGYYTEGRARLTAALQGSQAAETNARALALHGAGTFARSQGDYSQATALYEEALALRRALGDTLGVAGSLNNLGQLRIDLEDFERAATMLEEALMLKRTLGDKHSCASTLMNLGSLARFQGDYGRATIYYEEALMLAREAGDVQGLANLLGNLGVLADQQEHYGRAASLHEEALALHRELGDRRGITTSLINLGSVATAQGDYCRAETLYEEALMLKRELEDKRGIANALAGLGKAAQLRRDFEQARQLHGESLVIYQSLGVKLDVGACLQDLALLDVAQGQPARAARLFASADKLCQVKAEPLKPSEQAEYAGARATLRATLGDEAFAAAWIAGQTMSIDSAIALALNSSVAENATVR
jgi:predicted ATPase/DNA-binding SARP family transcriptional activator/uncharacterized protein HemY